MSLIIPIIRNDKGQIDMPIATYNPSQAVKDRTAIVKKDFEIGQQIMNSPYEEFGSNDRGEIYTLTDRLNVNQQKFNLYRPAKTTDPDLQWHANVIRPITRNKIISIVAHITSNILYPTIVAQNDDSTEDKEMALVMKDCVDWACEQSGYEDLFVNAIQDMCVNPAIIIYQGYQQVYRTVKEKLENGKIKSSEVLDEVWSGFVNSIVPCDELYIGNFYEQDIQKQPFLIRKKLIDYTTAELKYGKEEMFKYVKPGVKVLFDQDTDTYYEASDEELEDRLVEEAIFYNRLSDLELVYVNGVLIHNDPDRPIQRKDKQYPFAKSSYETYNSRSFYGMALAQKLEQDQDIVDKLYNMVIDGSYLSLAPPISVYGASEVDASAFQPNHITVFDNPNAKVEPLSLGTNLNAGLAAMQKVEGSISESSQDPRSAGLSDSGAQTKYEVQRLETNAQVILGRTGRMVSSLIKQFGILLVSSIIENIPVAEVGEVTGDNVKIKFPSLFFAERDVDGKKKARKIEFTNELPEAESQEELDQVVKDEEFKLLDLEEKLKMSIVKVRPDAFRRMKYLVKVDPNFAEKNNKFSKRMMLYDRGINNPIINQEQLVRETLLKELVPGKEDEFILSRDEQISKEAEKMNSRESLPQATPMNNMAVEEI